MDKAILLAEYIYVTAISHSVGWQPQSGIRAQKTQKCIPQLCDLLEMFVLHNNNKVQLPIIVM